MREIIELFVYNMDGSGVMFVICILFVEFVNLVFESLKNIRDRLVCVVKFKLFRFVRVEFDY